MIMQAPMSTHKKKIQFVKEKGIEKQKQTNKGIIAGKLKEHIPAQTPRGSRML